MTTTRRATIAGTGLYAPARVETNAFFDKKYSRDMDTFLREKRNIFERHFMADDQATSDLVIPAAEEALKNAGITAAEVDLLIISTDTPDYISPSTASVVQNKMSLTKAGTFDINTACAGFVTAVDVASKYIVADDRYRNILVAGAYGMSKYFDWTDHKVTSVFADGAGAAVIQRAPDSRAGELPYGILATELYTEGQYHDSMGIYAGGTRTPISDASIAARQHLLQFTKRIPPEMNVQQWPRLTDLLLERIRSLPDAPTDIRLDDVKHFFFTQININSIVETMAILGQPMSKAHNIMDRYGYTGSACIPMAIADANRKHELKKGDLCVILGSGGGVSMAAMALRWS